MSSRSLLSLVIALLLSACASMRDAPEPDQYVDEDPMLSEYPVAHAVVPEAFVSASTPDDNIDSPASWRAPDGKTWVFATAKVGGRLVIYDGDTGNTLRHFGSEGDGPGQFRRPNGIAVHGDLLFVVERDNHRVQILSLPTLKTLTTFGTEQLTQPYGLWVRERAPGDLDVVVTDAYMAGKRHRWPNSTIACSATTSSWPTML